MGDRVAWPDHRVGNGHRTWMDPPRSGPRSRIVVGVDGSPSSIAAVRWAAHHCEITGAQLQAVISWGVRSGASARPACGADDPRRVGPRLGCQGSHRGAAGRAGPPRGGAIGRRCRCAPAGRRLPGTGAAGQIRSGFRRRLRGRPVVVSGGDRAVRPRWAATPPAGRFQPGGVLGVHGVAGSAMSMSFRERGIPRAPGLSGIQPGINRDEPRMSRPDRSGSEETRGTTPLAGIDGIIGAGIV